MNALLQAAEMIIIFYLATKMSAIASKQNKLENNNLVAETEIIDQFMGLSLPCYTAKDVDCVTTLEARGIFHYLSNSPSSKEKM